VLNHNLPARPYPELDGTHLKELMLRYQQGDAQAADELVSLTTPLLSRYLYATSLRALNLDDLIQECWLRIHRSRGSYVPGEPVLPWLLAIVRHTRVDFFRKWQRTSGREAELPETARMPEVKSDTMQAKNLMNIISTLPEGQREVIVLLKLTGMTAEEVARATGSTAGAVKQKAYRAYQAIRQALQQDPEPQ
jgi:RNA polymerase sigma-70 factor (ECF subfamily)